MKHAQSFEADRNMRLRPCHTQCIRVHLPLQGHFQKDTINSCYKVHHCLYNIHQQHRLLVLQQDCFHIKIYKRRSLLTHSFIHSGPLVEFPVFFFHNNLTKTTRISALKCKHSFITLKKNSQGSQFLSVASTVQYLNLTEKEVVLKYKCALTVTRLRQLVQTLQLD